MTLCSVIIPCYNGAAFLGAALTSVFAQDHRPLEVIVVDDGSTDDTPAVAARWPDAIYLRQENGGTSSARNTGIAHARGEVIALLDVDDLWLPGKLRAQLALLEQRPDVDYVATRYRNFLEPGIEKPPWASERQLSEPLEGAISSMLIRAEALRRVGPFDLADPTDLDWSLRAQELGLRLAVVPEIFVERRIHAANLSYGLVARLPELRLRALRASIARKRARSAT